VKAVGLVLTLVSLTASIYYFVAGLIGPERMVVYGRVNIPVWGIRTWAVLLGAGGILLLFPSTFRVATVLMVMNSIFTIACLAIAKDLRGGLVEFSFLQIPVFLFCAGTPPPSPPVRGPKGRRFKSSRPDNSTSRRHSFIVSSTSSPNGIER
jgi:hypothetical protein